MAFQGMPRQVIDSGTEEYIQLKKNFVKEYERANNLQTTLVEIRQEIERIRKENQQLECKSKTFETYFLHEYEGRNNLQTTVDELMQENENIKRENQSYIANVQQLEDQGLAIREEMDCVKENKILRQRVQNNEIIIVDHESKIKCLEEENNNKLEAYQRKAEQEKEQLEKEHKKKCDESLQQLEFLTAKLNESEDELESVKQALSYQAVELEEKISLNKSMSESCYEDGRESEEKTKLQKTPDPMTTIRDSEEEPWENPDDKEDLHEQTMLRQHCEELSSVISDLKEENKNKDEMYTKATLKIEKLNKDIVQYKKKCDGFFHQVGKLNSNQKKLQRVIDNLADQLGKLALDESIPEALNPNDACRFKEMVEKLQELLMRQQDTSAMQPVANGAACIVEPGSVHSYRDAPPSCDIECQYCFQSYPDHLIDDHMRDCTENKLLDKKD